MEKQILNNSLDLSPEDFRALLDDSTDLVLQQFENLDTKKAFPRLPTT